MRSADAAPLDAGASAQQQVADTFTQLRPLAFASYIATSAWRIRESGSRSGRQHIAMPIEAPTCTCCESTYIGEADLARAIDAADCALFVATGADGSPAGYLYLQDAPIEQEAYIDYLGVDSDRRGRGLASALLGAAARWGAAHGRAHLALSVREDRPGAHALYRRHGFVEISAARHWRRSVATPTA